MQRLTMLLKFNFANRWTRVALLFIFIFFLLAIIGVARLHLLSSVRAFVGAESLYSKSQKDAVFHLEQYASSGDENDFQEYQRAISVPLGDRTARLALDQIGTDYATAREGFLTGGNNDDDIEDMIYAYRIFRHANFSINPIAAWASTDQQLIVLNAEANALHALLQTKGPDNTALQSQLQLSRARISDINTQLAELENTLSASLGRVTRDAQHLLLMMSLVIAVILLIVGVLVARFILMKSHKLEDALRISEERWHLAMIGSNDGLWDWDIAHRHVYYSPRMCELLGTTNFESGGDATHFEIFVHPEDLAPARAKLLAHLREQTPYDAEFRIITTNGELRWVRSRGQSLRSADGKALRMTGSITDITAGKQAEEQLYAEKERAQVTLESIGDAVVTVNVDGMIDYLNPAATLLTGWTLAIARGLPVTNVFWVISEASRERLPDLTSQILDQGKVPELETNLLLICRDGREVAINRSAAPIRNRNDQIIGLVFVLHDVSKDRAYATHLSYQASHDELTGLINRREFEFRLESLLAPEAPNEKHHTMLYLDLDQFKIVNDTCGHIAGDELLRQLAAILRTKLRQIDILARLGGDEFGVLLEACSLEPALRIAELLRQTVSEFRFVWQEKVFPIGVSIGMTSFANDGSTLPDILREADAACYVAKDKGRNRLHVFTPEDKELAQRHGEMGWIGRIQKALDEQRFVLYSQKIVALGDSRESGGHFEILLRMIGESGELIPPAAFIPAAERYGLMPSLDRWVIKNAFRHCADSLSNNIALETCAINLSGTSIGNDDLLPYIRAQFELYRVSPSHICFEITETGDCESRESGNPDQELEGTWMPHFP